MLALAKTCCLVLDSNLSELEVGISDILLRYADADAVSMR
jgi:hypothetical protein